jgi:hypothetical protein
LKSIPDLENARENGRALIAVSSQTKKKKIEELKL